LKKEKLPAKAGAGFLKKLALASVVALIGFIFFSLTLFHLIPPRVYERLVTSAVKEKTGLALKAASFDTVFPFGFEITGLRITDQRGVSLGRLDTLRADLNPLGLATGVRVDLIGMAGEGTIEGFIKTGLFSSGLELEARGVGFSYIEALGNAGIGIDGTFDGKVSLSNRKGGCPKGFARLEGVEVSGAGVKFRGFPLPLGSIDETGLSAEFRDCKAVLNGLWIEGTGVSLRLLGNMKITEPLASSAVDLSLEIVPHGDMASNQLLMSFISSYRKSANFYSIPIRGTLESISTGL